MHGPTRPAAVRRVAATVGAVAALVLASAAPAFAHVTVNPDEAEAGHRARLTFRVPTESDTAATVALQVHFPQEAPVPSVSTGVVPGWSVEVTYRTLDQPLDDGHGGQVTEAVETITWTADDPSAGIPPGQFGEFTVSLGPLPDVDEIALPALQTYSDGEVVRWIELPQPGVEPQFPAPVLTVTAPGAASGGDTGTADGGAGEPAADGPDAPPGESAAAASSSSSGAGVWLGGAGLVAGLAGLVLGGLALARTRATAGRDA
ncbi:MAG TPA: YcnI family protein [Natronosporangium sp.]|nr:YcnI family protein [Natronosporangium sp.]